MRKAEEDRHTKAQVLAIIRRDYPEFSSYSDDEVIKQVLKYYPMLRRRVVDEKGEPVWKPEWGEPDTLEWTGSKAKDNDFKGEYVWKKPDISDTPSHGASGEWAAPSTPATLSSHGATGQWINVPRGRVEPISSKLPGLADFRSGRDLPMTKTPNYDEIAQSVRSSTKPLVDYESIYKDIMNSK